MVWHRPRTLCTALFLDTPMPKAEALPTAHTSSRDTSDGIWSVLKNVRKHWPIVLASAMLSAGAGLAYSKSATKIYEAATLLEIDPNPIQPLKGDVADVLDMGAGNYWSTQEYYTTQYKLIVSERVLAKVAKDLALARDADFMDATSPEPPSTAKVTATMIHA